MSIEVPYEKQGHWWLPNETPHLVPGTIKISEEGEVELSLLGPLKKSDEHPLAVYGKLTRYEIVYGQTMDGTRFTLVGAYISGTTFNSSSGYANERLMCLQALAGEMHASTSLVFDRVSFCMPGLDEWLDIRGIQTVFPAQSKERLDADVTFRFPEEISHGPVQNMHVSFGFSGHLSSPGRSRELTMWHRAHVVVKTAAPVPMTDLFQAMTKVQRLIMFALFAPASLQQVQLSQVELQRTLDDGSNYPVYLQVFGKMRTYEDAKRHPFEMLFTYPQVRDRFNDILNQWFLRHEELKPPFNLYFACFTKRHEILESRFLSLAQALESLHRKTSTETYTDKETFSGLLKTLRAACPPDHVEWMSQRLSHGNEVSLRTRLNRLLVPFAAIFGEEASKKLVSEITDTRNYLTHYDAGLEKKAKKGKDLLALCSKMEVVFALHLLSLLSFSQEEIAKVCERAEIKNKLNPLFL